ncbi:pilin assembly protein [Pseudomonas lurida]|uniref:pilin assembly protein n=1 Tax=Pseudomonas lurida TaxID=244566 RepID=UPI00083D82ED|nr:pilin assembly protein [Pseudomonas lurida]
MKIRELAQHWEENAKGRLTKTEYAIHLDVESAARLAAIAEMYPKRSTEELLGELIGAALEELETSFPYIKGQQVIATDEEGDPLYEDVEHTIEKIVKRGQIHELRIFQPYVATAAFS